MHWKIYCNLTQFYLMQRISFPNNNILFGSTASHRLPYWCLVLCLSKKSRFSGSINELTQKHNVDTLDAHSHSYFMHSSPEPGPNDPSKYIFVFRFLLWAQKHRCRLTRQSSHTGRYRLIAVYRIMYSLRDFV